MKRIIVQVYLILLFATILANSATFEFPRDQKTDWQKYEYTMNILKQGEYEVAEKAFIELIALAWDRELLGNSYFWLGETYFVRENYKQAAKQYLALYQKYPDSEKAPNALFKLGTSLFKMKQKEQGCLSLNQLLANYPVINEKLKDRVTLDYKKNNCKTIIVSSNQDSNTEVASTTQSNKIDLKTLTNRQVCFNAIREHGEGFTGEKSKLKFVEEAWRRNLDINDCGLLSGFKAYDVKNLKDEQICYVAMEKPTNGTSQFIDHKWYTKYVNEVEQRNLSANDCHEILAQNKVADFVNSPFIKESTSSKNTTTSTKIASSITEQYTYCVNDYGIIGRESGFKNCIYGNSVNPEIFCNNTYEYNKKNIDRCNDFGFNTPNTKKTKIASSVTNKFVCQRATKSDGSSFESLSSNYTDYVEEAGNRGLNLESCNQLTGRGNKQTVTQTVQVPKTKVDNTSPILEVEDRITVTDRTYSIIGRVSDDSEVFVEADGISIPVKNNKFTIQGSSSIGITKYKIVAFDKWGNETSKDIIVERVIQTASNDKIFDPLRPENVRSKNNRNRIALIIGMEEYKNMSSANFAKRDAELFIDYAQSAFGISQSNIKYFINAENKIKFDIRRWLKKNVRKNTEVYLYFSGHGIALNRGTDLYLLTNDTEPDFVEETAFNRNEIFNDIAKYNPKSVTAFLDTCYSGAGRADGEILLAMAKGLVVVDEQQQKLPDNFTLFTAASAQESAWSLPEAKHGTFSYFLMKGIEGEADLDGNKKLTNGELQEYLLDNVSRYAQQQQTPQMIGDPDQVLVRF